MMDEHRLEKRMNLEICCVLQRFDLSDTVEIGTITHYRETLNCRNIIVDDGGSVLKAVRGGVVFGF